DLFADGETVAHAKVFGGAQGTVALRSPQAVRILVPRSGNERLTGKVVYNGPIRAPVKQGQPVGTLKIWRGDILTIEAPVQAAEDVPVGSTTQRAVDAAGELLYKLFRVGSERL